MDHLEIITTADGSHTLRNTQLNETYHSVHGAVQESMHVFIKNGLTHYCQQRRPEKISILEVGFGTGLNVLLTLQYAIGNRANVAYTALEPYPLPEAIWSMLNYGDPGKGMAQMEAIHKAHWGREVTIASGFSFLKLRTPLQEAQLNDLYDVVYFDAFAPSVQPELWDYASLEKVASVLNRKGVFVTYSAKGQLKRDLRSLGLEVETLAGPPGKKEMVRASRVL